MKTAYIFHDAFNDPTSDWYPWMKTTLEGMGYVTLVPKFPSPAAQSYESWKAVIKNHILTFDQKTLIVGHGTGGAFALRIIEELTQKIRGVFLVASYAEPIGHVGYDRLNETFVKHDFNWTKIKQTAEIHAVFGGSDDPFVPVVIVERLATHLGEQAHIIPDAGHLSKASGFTQAVIVVQIIQESLRAIDKSIVIEQVPIEEPIEQVLHQPSLLERDDSVRQPADERGVLGVARTMYKDMSELVSSNQGRVTSSILGKAREIVAEKKEKSPMSTKNIFFIVGTILVVLLGIGLMGYVFYQLAPANQQPVAGRLPSLIPSEHAIGINVTQKTFYELQSAIQKLYNGLPESNDLQDIVYLKGTVRASFPETLEALEIYNLPSVLKEQFTPTNTTHPVFMHGVFNNGLKEHHFLVIPFQEYDVLFEGMAEWEPTLFQDVGLFMGVLPEFIRGHTIRGIFADEMVSNRNVRALYYHEPAPKTPEEIVSTLSFSLTGSTSGTDSITSGELGTPFIPEPEPIILAPYREGDFMIGYFFLTQKTLVIVDDWSIVPELIKRWANRQIFE